MSVTDHPLTLADFDRCRWQEAIASVDKKETIHYCGEFGRRMRQAAESGDQTTQAVFTILFAITDCELRPDEISHPFGSRFSLGTARGVEPGDLPDDHFGILTELAPTIADPEMRARVRSAMGS